MRLRKVVIARSQYPLRVGREGRLLSVGLSRYTAWARVEVEVAGRKMILSEPQLNLEEVK